FHEHRETGRAEARESPQRRGLPPNIGVERVGEAALPCEQSRGRDGAGYGHHPADIRTRGPQVYEDALDRVLSLGNIHDWICLTHALDYAMSQCEVIEERAEIAHQLEDAEAEDEERHQNGPEEDETTGSHHLEHAEDQDEDQQDESPGRAGHGSHRQQQDDDRDEEDERESGYAPKGRGGEDDEEEV